MIGRGIKTLGVLLEIVLKLQIVQRSNYSKQLRAIQKKIKCGGWSMGGENE